VQTKTYSKFWVRASGICVLLAVLAVWFWIEAVPEPRVAPPADKAIAIDKSPGAQSARKALIDSMIAKGLVRSVDPPRGGTARMTLRAPFYLLDEPARFERIDAVYRYYFDGSSVNDTVILRDARHGNEVGHYNPYRDGLTMYK